ncbi:hypothetical protein WN48_06312 [Eufriesea mexicana]|nr:hypothetical protein WN48_06312 [Eufriesea mexicana]
MGDNTACFIDLVIFNGGQRWVSAVAREISQIEMVIVEVRLTSVYRSRKLQFVESVLQEQ